MTYEEFQWTLREAGYRMARSGASGCDVPLSYGLVIYNAQSNRDGRGVDLTTQMRLLHDGRVVLTGEPRRLEVANGSALKALFTGGTLLLPAEMPEGQYVLQVTVIDAPAPAKRQTAIQTINFEVVR